MSPVPALLDVNVLVALLWPRHSRHDMSQTWFSAARARGWATCPLTELGSARVLSSPAFSMGALTASSAVSLIQEILDAPDHLFWPDDVGISDGEFTRVVPQLQSGGQLTDRYLLSLAWKRGGVLATWDGRLRGSLPAGSDLFAHVEVLADAP